MSLLDEIQTELRFPAGSQRVDTSEDAADALSGDELNERRHKVLRLFLHAGVGGLTADEVVGKLGTGKTCDTNTWAPRVTELYKLGLLDRLDGKESRLYLRRRTKAGATAFVHVINAKGRSAC